MCVGCNTALHALRNGETFVPFLGMEPCFPGHLSFSSVSIICLFSHGPWHSLALKQCVLYQQKQCISTHSHCFQMLMVSLATDSIHACLFGAVRLRMALSLVSWPLQAIWRQFFATEGAEVVPADTGKLLCGQGKRKCSRLSTNSDYAWSGKAKNHTSAFCKMWYKT